MRRKTLSLSLSLRRSTGIGVAQTKPAANEIREVLSSHYLRRFHNCGGPRYGDIVDHPHDRNAELRELCCAR